MNKPALAVIKSDVAENWQQILADLITNPKELVEILDLDLAERGYSSEALDAFPMKVPRPFVERMERGNWADPLLNQVWPHKAEELEESGRSFDPLAETEFNQEAGLLHKYDGRVLLTAAPHCAVHCRYCFRRHFDYKANTPGRARWREALDYIAQDCSIREVILSGGDPLAASDSYVQWLLAELEAIPHIDTIRIHTRLPIVIPQRVNTALREILQKLRAQCVVVLHCNHSNEVDAKVAQAIKALTDDGHTVLNQAVLLQGINDNAETLVNLNKALFAHNVLPYYLHFPDQVIGTGHFDVSEHKAKALIDELRHRLPGYLVPKLVREDAGELSKTRLA